MFPNSRTPAARVMTWAFALVLGVLAVLFRIAPYYWFKADQDSLWNLMPVGALALFAGSRLRTPFAVALPVLVMFVSDLLLIQPLADMGFSAFSWGRPFIYLSFAAYFFLGRLVPEDSYSPIWVLATALVGGAQFFLITNALAWYGNIGVPPMNYTGDLSGLMQSYISALPFHRQTLFSDLVFSLLFFGAHALLLLALARPGEEKLPALEGASQATGRPAWGSDSEHVTRREEGLRS
jgi:hypothetical protein